MTDYEYIPIKPMSVNDAWKGRRQKTYKYLNYEKAVGFFLPSSFKLPKPPYRIEYEFGFSSKASDVDNPAKQITDILSKKYGFNDNQIYEMNLRKCIVPKGKEYIKWKIEHLPVKNP